MLPLALAATDDHTPPEVKVCETAPPEMVRPAELVNPAKVPAPVLVNADEKVLAPAIV